MDTIAQAIECRPEAPAPREGKVLTIPLDQEEHGMGILNTKEIIGMMLQAQYIPILSSQQ